MSGFTQFENKENPIIIPAVEEKTYNKYWLRLMTVTSSTPQDKATLYAEFRPCRDLENGDKEVKFPEENGDIKVIRIDDLFALAFQNNDFAIDMEMVFRALKKYAFPESVTTTTTTTLE